MWEVGNWYVKLILIPCVKTAYSRLSLKNVLDYLHLTSLMRICIHREELRLYSRKFSRFNNNTFTCVIQASRQFLWSQGCKKEKEELDHKKISHPSFPLQYFYKIQCCCLEFSITSSSPNLTYLVVLVCHFLTGIWDLNLDFQSEFNSFTTAAHGEMELTLSHDIQPMKVKHFKSYYCITYVHILPQQS